MFSLKKFQEEAIADLRLHFLELWETSNRRLPLIFKAPTGSGKTIMVAQFLQDLTGDPQFDVDKCFLWFSFNEDSYIQSKNKLFDYYRGANELELLDLNDLNRGLLQKNNIFFINWQKIKSSTKEGRKLRRDNELGINFDNFIKATQESGREMVLIVDEAHRDKETDLADEIIDLIDPRIILEVTATPKNEPSASDVKNKRKGFVEVTNTEARECGLIKDSIVTLTEEDLEKSTKKEVDQDIMLLNLAFEKRLELIKLYKELKRDINPIVLIQLPNDDQARKETLDKSKMDIVRDYLRDKKVNDHEIATWLSEKKENMEEIAKNNSKIGFLIFKQAAATGWDCPRASILVMFREIKSPVFHKQTLGRILRMPEAKHYPKPALNVGYLYTNYDREEITKEYKGHSTENKPAYLESKRKTSIKPIKLLSTFTSRTDYNDLGDSFQTTFKKVANNKLKISASESIQQVIKKLQNKGLEIFNPRIENRLIVGAEIEDYDNFAQEIAKSGKDINQESSRNDLERLYNLLCFNIIAKQEDEDKKFAPERSWGKLKTALNVWLSEILKEKREVYYKIIVKDLLKSGSVLKPIIAESLEKYRPIREKEIETRAMKAKRIEELEIPQEILYFTDDYEIFQKVKKSAMKPFYINKQYKGRENETNFIKYLESKKSILWWYKSGDYGSQYFSIPYFNEVKKTEKLFYPDWIIMTQDKQILIFDTKAGITADQTDTKNKAEELQKWLKSHKIAGFGGIVAQTKDGIWKVNKKATYSYNVKYTGWENLDELIK